MNPQAQEDWTRFVTKEPELVAVPAARQHRLIFGLGERLPHTRCRVEGVGQPCRGYCLSTLDEPVVENHLGEPGEVTKRRRDAPVVDSSANRVAGDLGVEFRT